MDAFAKETVSEMPVDRISQPTVIDIPSGREEPQTQQSPAYDSFAENVPPSPKKHRLIIALVACVGIVAIAALVFFLNRQGKPEGPERDPSDVSVIQGTQPAVVDQRAGNTIKALERPKLVTPIRVEATVVGPAQFANLAIEPGLANVSHDNCYLTDEAKARLEKYGFTAREGGYKEFFECYEMNRYAYVPNFVTVDSLMHTYHLYYQYLQKNLERDYLAPTLAGMSKQLLEASEAQYQALKGTEWENAAQRNVAFFAVGALLQDSSVSIPSHAQDVVSSELSKIQSATSMEQSAVTGEQEDYTQYKPRGYYEGNEVLEQYFRTMIWYGRINFTQKNEDLDRSALLMTMALQGEAQQRWEAIYTVTSFFAGASDDCGYYEYKPLLDAAYGADVTASTLAGNTDAWTHYHELTAMMPAPMINSIPSGSNDSGSNTPSDVKGWRLMGQRFSLDAMVFQNLISDSVGPNASNDKRTLPDALDVPAAMGSDEALSILESRGATGYAGYTDNMSTLRTILSDEENVIWNASLYSQWLYTLKPLLSQKDENYPSFMQSSQWTRKSLQSYLGSYTELKHDTVLYAKQVMSEGGGGGRTADDRGYVEPEPVVFSRLANLTNATMEGLANYNLISDADRTNLDLLRQLAEKLSVIAGKELRNELPTEEEFELIRSYGEQIEHFWQEVYKGESQSKYLSTNEFPSAVIADIATDGVKNTVLEVGTGAVGAIYVVVPVDGSLRVACGSIYTFYQFEQPASQRLTDTEWRRMMGIEVGENNRMSNANKKDLEDWTQDFMERTQIW
ncbi:MAG: DUF3160 domain-containing protein [Coriobacteriales bacterium]|nr:DUF3160 domain-containing protein [Coriobacteriales bacterium]